MKVTGRWGVALIIFGLLPNLVLPFTFERFEYPKLILVYLLTSVLLITMSVYLFQRKKIVTKLKFYIVDLLIILFLGVSLISLLFAVSPWAAFFGVWDYQQGGVIFLLCSLIIYWYFRQQMFDQKKTTIIAVICLIGIGVALAGSFLDKTGPFFQGLTIRSRSTQGHPVFLANYLIIGVPVLLSLLLTVKQIWKKTLLVTFLGILLTGVILSLTRSSWFALGFTLVFCAVMFWKKYGLIIEDFFPMWLTVGFAGFVLILTILFWPLFSDRIKLTLIEPAVYNSVSKRLVEYKTALKIIIDNPLLGVGPAGTSYVYPKYRSAELNKNDKEWYMDVLQIRNFYLETATTAGISGLLILLGIIITVVVLFIRFFLKLSKTGDSLLMLGFFGSFLAISIHFLFYGITVTVQFLFWSSLGILMAGMKKYYLPVKELEINFSSVQKKITAVSLVMAGMLLMWGGYYDIRSNISFKGGLVREAVDLSPWRMDYRKTLAFKNLQIVSPLLSSRAVYEEKIGNLLLEAQENLDFVEKIDPKNPELVYYQAIWSYQKFRLVKNTQLEIQSYLQALDNAQKAIQLDPTDPRVVDLRTLVYLEKGKEVLPLAVESARDTIKLKYNYSPGHYHLGEALKQLGKFDEAVKAYQEVLSYNPKDLFAVQEIEKIESLLK